MKFTKNGADFFTPDGSDIERALYRTTHIGIGAHHDDLEILAYDGILKCFGDDDNNFLGVIASNGGGSPRSDIYGKISNEEMKKIRKKEQEKAAVIGGYSGIAFLDYTSTELKDANHNNCKEDIKTIICAAKPNIVYTHSLADKHDTHVAVAIRTIQALREVPNEMMPKEIYGCEVWRGLDWLSEGDKVAFDVSLRENLSLSLIGVFDSQISGGKRYDLATLGRRRANATYGDSHSVDTTQLVIFAHDLSPLLEDSSLSMAQYMTDYIERFKKDVANRIVKFS